MATNTILTKAYAVNIFKYGNRSFSTIPTDYHDPVKTHAATTFSLGEIDNALVENYISQEEYDTTLSIKKAEQESPLL
ncbi:hypothetical protein [Lysinibacillus sp.]|uniref:hypothetical protein n=1 Tax=Lysinibacillus sp. TaxID=1869345 RepID=UPI0028A5A931|nr:hypothetical protein [Lysinibacillus sp.]